MADGELFQIFLCHDLGMNTRCAIDVLASRDKSLTMLVDLRSPQPSATGSAARTIGNETTNQRIKGHSLFNGMCAAIILAPWLWLPILALQFFVFL